MRAALRSVAKALDAGAQHISHCVLPSPLTRNQPGLPPYYRIGGPSPLAQHPSLLLPHTPHPTPRKGTLPNWLRSPPPPQPQTSSNLQSPFDCCTLRIPLSAMPPCFVPTHPPTQTCPPWAHCIAASAHNLTHDVPCPHTPSPPPPSHAPTHPLKHAPLGHNHSAVSSTLTHLRLLTHPATHHAPSTWHYPASFLPKDPHTHTHTRPPAQTCLPWAHCTAPSTEP